MDRISSTTGLSRRADGELARALGIDQRRPLPRAAQVLREPYRRNSMEPALPFPGELATEPTLRRHSMPSVLASAAAVQNAYAENLPLPALSSRSAFGNFRGALRGALSGALNDAIHGAIHGAPAGTRGGGRGGERGGERGGARGGAQADERGGRHERARRGTAPLSGARQLTRTGAVGMPGLREDYYSTLIASACAADASDGEDWAFMHEAEFEQSDEDLLSLNRLGEVLLVMPAYACRWTPQLGSQLFEHYVRGDVTCVAVTRLGFSAISDTHGHLLLFDMVCDPPALILRQRLSDVVDFGGHFGPSTAASKHYATHLVWSDKLPSLQAGTLSRCGYRAEIFVGTNRGAICKLCVDARLGVVPQTVSPPRLAHRGAISAMTLDYNQDTLAVAGVDCEVSVWLHYAARGPARLRLQHRLRQASAVKGLAFCPGLEHLLAVGGGRRDRALRVYDTQTGKLLREVPMPAQVVGVLWLSRWEAFVALGHSRRGHYAGLGQVYNLASDRVVCNVPGPGYALSAVRTKTGVSVYTSHSVLIEFRWTPEASPAPSADVLAALNVTYPPSALR